MVLRAAIVGLILMVSGAAWAAENAPPDSPPQKSVGVAKMLENGTILVGVPGPGDDDRAQAVLEISPGDSTYQPLLDHVGGLKPGESKPIPPWPDPPPPPKNDDKRSGPPPGA